MKDAETEAKVRGVISPVITPCREDYSWDVDAFRQNIDFWVECGVVNGKGCLLVCGGGGEGPFMDDEEWKTLTKTAVDAAAGRVPIVAGMREASTRKTIEEAKYAADVGAIALQLPPPLYYGASDDDIYSFYEAVATGAPAKVVIYNTYWRPVNLKPDLVVRLAEVDNIVGIKWGVPFGVDYSLMRLFSDRLQVIDNGGGAVNCHILGGAGKIAAAGDFYPQYDLKVWELCEKGDYAAATEMIKRLAWPLHEFRVKVSQRTRGEAPVKKAALELVGQPAGPPQPPSRPITEEERNELRQILIDGGVPVVA